MATALRRPARIRGWPGRCAAYYRSDCSRTLVILVGLAGGSPTATLSTFSMPSITWPQTVYWPLRNWRVGEADEELAVGAVRVLRAGGTHRAAHERLLVELGHDVALARAAGAGAGGIAGLGHEARDDAVEDDAVVEPSLGQLLDPGDVLGRHVGQELDQHAAARGQLDDERVVGIGGLGGGGGHEQDGSG